MYLTLSHASSHLFCTCMFDIRLLCAYMFVWVCACVLYVLRFEAPTNCLLYNCKSLSEDGTTLSISKRFTEQCTTVQTLHDYCHVFLEYVVTHQCKCLCAVHVCPNKPCSSCWGLVHYLRLSIRLCLAWYSLKFIWIIKTKYKSLWTFTLNNGLIVYMHIKYLLLVTCFRVAASLMFWNDLEW